MNKTHIIVFIILIIAYLHTATNQKIHTNKYKINESNLYDDKITVINDDGKFVNIDNIKDFKIFIFVSVNNCNNECIEIIKKIELNIENKQKILPMLITINPHYESIDNIKNFKNNNNIKIKGFIIDNYNLIKILHKMNNFNYLYNQTIPAIYLIYPNNKKWLKIENNNNINNIINNIETL